MDADTFRKDPERVSKLQTALSDPTLQEALLVIHDAKSIKDAPDGGTELASVRILSKMAGRSEVISELWTLATHLDGLTNSPQPDFGTIEKPPEGWVPI